MTKKKKIGIALIGVLVIALIIVYAVKSQGGISAKEKEESIYVQTGEIERGAIESVIYTKGDVVAKERANLSVEVTGTVETLYFKEGDAVAEGDPILKLETTAIEKSIRDAKLQLEIAQENYASSINTKNAEKNTTQTQRESAIRNAKLLYENAQKTYEETSALFEAGVVSAKEKDSAKLAYDQAYNAYLDAQNTQSIKSDTSKVYALQLEAARNTYNDLLSQKEKYTLRAPMSGVLTQLGIKALDVVSPALQVGLVETVNDLKIKTSIGEYDIANIKVGMPVRITGNAVGESVYNGKIESIAAAAVVQGNERTVPVVVALEGETAFKPNFTANLEIVFAKSENALLVPYEAWQNTAEGDFIYTVKDGKAVRHAVKLGVKGEIKIEVIGEGFDETSVVVLKPPVELKEGSAVVEFGGE